ncbi:TIGR01777 family oxidoreductase [Mobilicoccus pelagius]|uniref:TIGR01777 family oxidoreductase n=1 Tax=Mobilicoccus pelagius TaxID=746032 RepID=UPI00058F1B26|nr:TIGR01777 family oxidoreductase [Mobilicoccus pelagius]
MRVAITGASGLIGSVLSQRLAARGDRVVHLVRRQARSSAEREWIPGAPLDPTVLDDVDAVVHLAGAGVGDKRWTAKYRRTIRRSRIDGTRTLAQAVLTLDRPVRVVSGSAVGIYGSDRGEELLTETSTAGKGFLADVVRAWEAEMRPAREAGVPVAFARTGIVLSPDGGAMERVLPLARLGLGGPLGDGQQWWPLVTLDDEVSALLWLVDHPQITGPVNIALPDPVRQGEFMALLGEELHRPAVLPAPAFALRAMLGQFADDILGSQRVRPDVLLDSGFTFASPTGETAAQWLVTRDKE